MAMRNAFIDELVTLAKKHSNIALIVGDLGYSVIEPFADQFPDRFINAGVAEQNMTGLAAGLASEGYHVFTYSIANFPIFRCAEQIRNDVDYQKLPVTIVAVGGGLAYGPLGYSHHAVQDYALMRMMPNTLIAAPGDPMEVRACMRYLVGNPQPSYLRIGKAGEPTYHDIVPDIKPGHWIRVGEKSDGSIPKKAMLTTGAALSYAMEFLNNNSLSDVAVYSQPLWGMMTKNNQQSMASLFDEILTLEDHLIDGGFGSWFREALANDPQFKGRLQTLGLDPLVCGLVGSQARLNNIGGLNLEMVMNAFDKPRS